MKAQRPDYMPGDAPGKPQGHTPYTKPLLASRRKRRRALGRMQRQSRRLNRS